MSTGLELAKRIEGEILGPNSGFTIARSERRKEWLPIIESAKTLTITDKESHETAVGHGRLLVASSKEVEKLFTFTKQMIDAVKKPVLEMEKQDMAAINEAKNALGAKVQAYVREQEKIQMEARRAAEAEARKADEERRIAEAIAAESAGNKEEAEYILDEPSMPMPAIVQAPVTKMAGQVIKTTYSCQVDDLLKLVKGVAAGIVPIQAIKADEPWINKQAVSYKTGLNYPGVSVKETTSTHFRA